MAKDKPGRKLGRVTKAIKGFIEDRHYPRAHLFLCDRVEAPKDPPKEEEKKPTPIELLRDRALAENGRMNSFGLECHYPSPEKDPSQFSNEMKEIQRYRGRMSYVVASANPGYCYEFRKGMLDGDIVIYVPLLNNESILIQDDLQVPGFKENEPLLVTGLDSLETALRIAYRTRWDGSKMDVCFLEKATLYVDTLKRIASGIRLNCHPVQGIEKINKDSTVITPFSSSGLEEVAKIDAILAKGDGIQIVYCYNDTPSLRDYANLLKNLQVTAGVRCEGNSLTGAVYAAAFISKQREVMLHKRKEAQTTHSAPEPEIFYNGKVM